MTPTTTSRSFAALVQRAAERIVRQQRLVKSYPGPLGQEEPKNPLWLQESYFRRSQAQNDPGDFGRSSRWSEVAERVVRKYLT